MPYSIPPIIFLFGNENLLAAGLPVEIPPANTAIANYFVLFGTPPGPITLPAMTNASDNVYIGDYGPQNTLALSEGCCNVFIGISNGRNLTTGFDNVGIGDSNLLELTTGTDNTVIGTGSGLGITQGISNIFIGSGATATVAPTTATNRIGIGTLATVAADNLWTVGKLGTKQAVKEGANGAMGASTLVAGTVTVNNTLVTANSRIFLTGQNSSGTHGELTVSARVAGTSFTITSSSGTDTRLVAWEIKEPG